MAKKAKQLSAITFSGKPLADDLFVMLVARALAERQPKIELAAVDGRIVEKKKQNKRR